MSIVSNFPKGRSLISEETLSIAVIGKDRKLYYKNIIRYLDEHLYFNYLKLNDAEYGLNFNTQLPTYIPVSVGVSTSIILYQRAFPEDGDDINVIVLNLIKENIQNGILSVTQNIRDVKEQLS